MNFNNSAVLSEGLIRFFCVETSKVRPRKGFLRFRKKKNIN